MDLRTYLDENGIRYQWLHHDVAYTAQDLAQREHVSGRKVVKPVLVEADGQFVLCALPAPDHIDMERLRQELKAEKARLGDEAQLAQIFRDCEIGAEPPIGQMYGIPTVIDESVNQMDEVVFQAGTHRDAVKMSFDDYMKLTRPRMARFKR